MNKKDERINSVKINNYGESYYVFKYVSAKEIYVKFENDHIVKTSWSNFEKSQIFNPYTKKVFNVGFTGEGKYKKYINGKMTRRYNIWYHMLKRCYDPHYINTFTTYRDCFVCEEWHNFQNFAQWYSENYYEVYRERVELDKDILIKNNKIYSKDTCSFVPRRINSLLIKSDKVRGEYLIGVHFCDRNSKYVAQLNKLDKRVFLGYFQTEMDAFNEYKIQKEIYIKEVINEYKNKIPETIYNSLLSYIVEVQD